MFKKYSKNSPDDSTDLFERRPHSPFSSDLMNSFQQQDLTPYLEEQEPETVIAAQVEIKGSISFQKLLRIDGSFEGELISSGKLIVGSTGTVKADIDLDEAFISGKVIGNITVKTRLTLRGRADVTGDIKAPLISVDEGVSITGNVHVASTQKPVEEEEENPYDEPY